MDLKMLWWAAGVAATIGAAGWTAKATLATKEDVKAEVEPVSNNVVVAGAQAQFALDLQIDNIQDRIARLKRIIEEKQEKGQPVAAELKDLDYWRGVLERTKKMRAGQK